MFDPVTDLNLDGVGNEDWGGMGSFDRSRHQLVSVFQVGTALHINNVELAGMGAEKINVRDQRRV